MSAIAGILGMIGSFSIDLITQMGYAGVFILMVLESMIFPMPSELVMPFAGFAASRGELSMLFVIIASTLGSLVGSLLSYYIGYFGGNRLVTRFGKYLLLDEEDLRKTEQWFMKRGEITILIGRLIPVVRHLISIPAGIGKMDLLKFSAYTVIGATAWNTFLAYLGYLLGKNWDLVRHYTEPLSIAVALLLVAACVFLSYRHFMHRRRKKH